MTEKTLAISRPDIFGAVAAASGLGRNDEAKVREAARHVRRPAEFVAVELGLVSEDVVVDALSKVTGYPKWRPAEISPDSALRQKLGQHFLEETVALPVRRSGSLIDVAIADPFDHAALTALSFALGAELAIWVGSKTDILAALRLDGEEGKSVSENETGDDVNRLTDESSAAPAARLLQSIFTLAVDRGASDIHLEPKMRHAEIRLRVDGGLDRAEAIPKELAQSLVKRVKVLSAMDIGDNRLPQDGRLSIAVRGVSFDIRCATSPSLFGETLTMRLLERRSKRTLLADLGFSEQPCNVLTRAFSRQHGLLLVAGPTGSGKTTTLYAGLESLAKADLKIISIEDPIEVQLEHVVQVQIASEIGLSFASALRSMLRHDPNVLMVGEIRDSETAQIAVQAALTGHLVVASIHARDAIRATSRILDMGVAPYQLSAALMGVVAQRLVQRICDGCRGPDLLRESDQRAFEALGLTQRIARCFRGEGCERCNQKGFGGRVVVAEGFLASEAFSTAVGKTASIADMTAIAAASGYKALVFDAFDKVERGEITFASALQVGLDA
jgi:general secretion pathway protein E